MGISLNKKHQRGRGGGAALFSGRGVLPIQEIHCYNCVDPYQDGFKCNEKTDHRKCTNCLRYFPERAAFDQ